MGSIIGKENVAEPVFQVLLQRAGQTVKTSYEIRRYNERFAAEVRYQAKEDVGSPFRALARYIGVFGSPENNGQQPISMTAPVVMQNQQQQQSIARDDPNGDDDGHKVMKFILPAELDSMEKIPKPTNPNVQIEAIPSQVGVVHRFSGFWSDEKNQKVAVALAEQLTMDGIDRMSKDFAMQHYEFWGYNPPFTLPMFRRNEIWIELTEKDVQQLLDKFNVPTTN
jgi:hypothetical protein